MSAGKIRKRFILRSFSMPSCRVCGRKPTLLGNVDEEFSIVMCPHQYEGTKLEVERRRRDGTLHRYPFMERSRLECFDDGPRRFIAPD